MNEVDFQRYCTGCGLCCSEAGVTLKEDERGFRVAQLDAANSAFCQKICPAAGVRAYLQDGVWGHLEEIYGGWSTNKEIRYAASSGGVLSAMAIWLLASKTVDGIIQTKVSDEDPTATQTVCSTTAEEVKSCLGSRYAASSPLERLSELIRPGKKYAVIGRPCDILALQNYRSETGKYAAEIVCTLAFFCAGTPSRNANQNLLQALNCANGQCSKLTYRGNGWPGYVTAVDQDGNCSQLSYAEGWSKYLGRDLRPICRFCMDGTGAAADISCGDYWQLQDGKPLFTEGEGRNLIFARTQKGNELLLRAQKEGVVELCSFAEGREHLQLVQPAQYERVVTMRARVRAMQVCGRSVPVCDLRTMKRFSAYSSMKKRVKIFWGTVKRVWAGKI